MLPPGLRWPRAACGRTDLLAIGSSLATLRLRLQARRPQSDPLFSLVQNMLSPRMYAKVKATLLVSMLVATAAVVVVVITYVMASPTFGWTGERPAGLAW